MLSDTDAKYTVDVVAPASPENRAALLQQLHARSIDGILSIQSSSTGAFTATYTSLASVSFADIGAMQDQLNRGIVNERLLEGGMKPDDVAAALKWVPIETLQLNKQGKAGKSSGIAPFYKSFVLLLLLSMPIMLYGLDMARAIIEEKTSRIFEVMLAVARPDDLLAGKMVGVGAVGLTQIAIWVLASVLVLGSSARRAFALRRLQPPFLLDFEPPLPRVLRARLRSLQRHLLRTGRYLRDLAGSAEVYASGHHPALYGHRCSSLAAEGSQLRLVHRCIALPAHLALCHAPRVELQMPPMWQIGAPIGLLLLAIWSALWFSSRLYRIGILMYGKRATLPEFLRWLRYS